jgi:nicotinate-nucleotide adenylyltransferase
MCAWLIAPGLLGDETITQSEVICQQVEQLLKQESFTFHWQFLNIPLVGISSSLIPKIAAKASQLAI